MLCKGLQGLVRAIQGALTWLSQASIGFRPGAMSKEH